jgi:hypothetical protein
VVDEETAIYYKVRVVERWPAWFSFYDFNLVMYGAIALCRTVALESERCLVSFPPQALLRCSSQMHAVPERRNATDGDSWRLFVRVVQSRR